MTKYRIEYDKKGCIGAAACVAAAPNFWDILNGDTKAVLKGSRQEGDDIWILEIENPDDFEANLAAAQVCPVNVIHITNLDTGEKLV